MLPQQYYPVIYHWLSLTTILCLVQSTVLAVSTSDDSDPQYSAETRIFARIFQRRRARTVRVSPRNPELLLVESKNAASWLARRFCACATSNTRLRRVRQHIFRFLKAGRGLLNGANFEKVALI